MTVAQTLSGPQWLAPVQGLGKQIMDILLHVGAHRTGTTSFQRYLADHADPIAAQGTCVWGPRQTRGGLFAGLFPASGMLASGPNLVNGRVSLLMGKARDLGADQLLISDENMIGSARHSVRSGRLFPAIGERMARFGASFGGRVTQVVLTIRQTDHWWASALAYTVGRGHPVPDADQIDRIAHDRRGWRDVITDLACALPEAKISIARYDDYAGRPDALFTQLTGRAAPATTQGYWLNRRPDEASLRAQMGPDAAGLRSDGLGNWHPFSDAQAAALRETYADDLFWLTAGADGLATLTETSTAPRAGTSWPDGDRRKGHHHDSGQRKLAQSG
jgi:hypothetical protein